MVPHAGHLEPVGVFVVWRAVSGAELAAFCNELRGPGWDAIRDRRYPRCYLEGETAFQEIVHAGAGLRLSKSVGTSERGCISRNPVPELESLLPPPDPPR